MDNLGISAAKAKKYRYRYRRTAYLMIAPVLILLTIFVFIPLAMSLVRSFQDTTTGEFVLFANFKNILLLSSFRKSFFNMLILVPAIVILQMLLSFLFALVLTKLSRRISGFARTVIYIPVLLSGIITSVIYLLITNYGGGLITSILYLMDKDAIAFATDKFWAKVIIIVPTIWQAFGYNVLVMYAGLIAIPATYYEAASIDGAGGFVKLTRITLPNMGVYALLILINLVTANLQLYEVPLMMTQGGPLESTLTPVLFLMANHNGGRETNVVIAGALIVMVVIVAINMVVFSSMRSGSRKAEEG